jgi:hypothetical protein
MSTVYPLDLQRRVDRIWATRMALSPDRAGAHRSLASFASEPSYHQLLPGTGNQAAARCRARKKIAKRQTGDMSGVAITLFPQTVVDDRLIETGVVFLAGNPLFAYGERNLAVTKQARADIVVVDIVSREHKRVSPAWNFFVWNLFLVAIFLNGAQVKRARPHMTR